MNKKRQLVREYLFNEVFGPTIDTSTGRQPLPEPDSNGVVHIPADADKYISYYDETTQEIYLRGSEPKMLYGTGVLHAPDTNSNVPGKDGDSSEEEPVVIDDLDDDEIELPKDIKVFGAGKHGGAEEGEAGFTLEETQKRHPSAIGLTCHPEVASDGVLKVSFQGSIYVDRDVQYSDREKPNKWFLRKQLSGVAEIKWADVLKEINKIQLLTLLGEASDYIEILLRLRRTEQTLVLTVVAVHRGEKAASNQDVFQTELTVEVSEGSSFKAIPNAFPEGDLEMQETEYLYRHAANFATGHGAAAVWDLNRPYTKIAKLQTKAIPEFYQEVLDFDHLNELEGMVLSMERLGKLEQGQVKETFRTLVTGYENWIKSELSQLDEKDKYFDAANRMASRASAINERIQAGVDLLSDPANALALESFCLANTAMFLQQKNGARKKRELVKPEKSSKGGARNQPAPKVTWEDEKPFDGYGNWRPFQLAFLLASLPGMVDANSADREEVDLIFFPTGGGKTEAYLGVSAFSIFYDRLTKSAEDAFGTNVLMRYTLRLLTIQQFERSSGLITAMEFLRRKNPERLGNTQISIGIWVGDATTKNQRSDLLSQLKPGQEIKADDPHPFILSKCPWCSREFGWSEAHEAWIGFSGIKGDRSSKTMHFVCHGEGCEFRGEENYLPIWLSDEDIYEVKPSFILATVDKFARMAWKEEARNLFNIGPEGNRVGRPPTLIIQDEMHLISGPLGSMVGIYEGVIENLCTDDRVSPPVRPKIIASTATTRRYREQIESLYSRKNVTLFPQAISRANETYFSTILRDENGEAAQGTLYLGINPATYATGQTAAARIAAVLSQAPNAESVENDPDMNYYRTQMWFFNSLRELGMTQTLMTSTVQDVIKGMGNDRRLPKGKLTYFNNLMELTSRIPSNEVASSLSKLEEKNEAKLIQACLASSIMEVGVDVKRLGLLVIMSQPKTTSQYIQVAGRVGRDRNKGPGLVVMLYNTARSRDRSMYERFISYHQRLYAQVEPVSVTPFALEAMRRGLSGAILSYYRMKVKQDSVPDVLIDQIWDEAVEVMTNRLLASTSDPQKLQDFRSLVLHLKNDWLGYLPPRWAYTPSEESGTYQEPFKPALMRFGKDRLKGFPGEGSIQVPASMRSVDGQTEVLISHNPYAFDIEESN